MTVFVAGREVSRPKEEIQANAARARHQAARDGRGRTEAFESGQSSGRHAVGRDGRLDFFSPPGGTTG